MPYTVDAGGLADVLGLCFSRVRQLRGISRTRKPFCAEWILKEYGSGRAGTVEVGF